MFGAAGMSRLKQLSVAFILFGIVWPMYASQPSDGTDSLPGIEGKATAGIGGYYRIGRCTPVTIRLENSGRDLEGNIRIQISPDRYTQQVSLPSPSQKTLAMHIVPLEDLNELEISIYAGEKLLKKIASKMRRLSDEQRLTVLSSSLKSYALALDASPENASGEKRVFLDPVDFPESWKDYDAVDSVMLDISDATKLNSRQRNAISQWTLLGGRVNLLDRHRASAGEQSQAGTVIDRSRTSRERTQHGIGTFATFGLADPVLSHDNGDFTGYRPSIPDLDREIFHSVRIRNPFSRSYILWYAGLFFLVYSAVLAVWLRVFNTSCWAKFWRLTTVPLLAALFTLLAPWVGRAGSAGNTTVRQQSILHVFANSTDIFTVNDFVMLFPGKADYLFHPVFPSSHLVQNESKNEMPAITFEFNKPGAPSISFEENLWGTRSLNQSYFTDSGLFLALPGPETITLTNRSPYSLEECLLIRGGVSIPIGPIPAGEEIRVNPSSVFDPNRSESELFRNRTDRNRSGGGIFPGVVASYSNEANTETMGDLAVCSVNGSFPGMTSDTMNLSYTGSAAVVFHLGTHSDNGSDSDLK